MATTRQKDLRLCGLALVAMAICAWIHLIAADVPWLRRLEIAAFDAQTRLRGTQKPGVETVIVMIDDQTIAELGHWPLPRQRLAELVSVLNRAGAVVIGIRLRGLILCGGRKRSRAFGARADHEQISTVGRLDQYLTRRPDVRFHRTGEGRVRGLQPIGDRLCLRGRGAPGGDESDSHPGAERSNCTTY